MRPYKKCVALPDNASCQVIQFDVAEGDLGETVSHDISVIVSSFCFLLFICCLLTSLRRSPPSGTCTLQSRPLSLTSVPVAYHASESPSSHPLACQRTPLIVLLSASPVFHRLSTSCHYFDSFPFAARFPCLLFPIFFSRRFVDCPHCVG